MNFELRPFQKQALDLIRRRGSIDLVVIAPTGSGKGVILEELGRDIESRILLLCPLIALGRQLQARFNSRGIPASCRMGLSDPELKMKDRIWILSPESLFNSGIHDQIRQWRPSLVSVDEAHCIEEWGSRFRPEYAKIPHWIRSEGTAKTLWMSATLPRSILPSLEAALGRSLEVQGTYSPPPGLTLKVREIPWSERLPELLRFLDAHPDPGIIFTGTRKMTDRISDWLHIMGRPVVRYHAGMSREERRQTEERLVKHPESLVVATSAFGMGMDYPQFRWSFLLQPTYSLLSLLQSIGRVGRNGSQAKAQVLWHPEDFQIIQRSSQNDPASLQKLRPLRRFLESRSVRQRLEILQSELV